MELKGAELVGGPLLRQRPNILGGDGAPALQLVYTFRRFST